jgi:hypothetical protein
MNGKKAKALRRLTRVNARTPRGEVVYQSVHPKGLTKTEFNPRFVVGGVGPKFFVVTHPGTLKHKPASFGSLYHKMKAMSKKPGHHFEVGGERVTTRQFLAFMRWVRT